MQFKQLYYVNQKLVVKGQHRIKMFSVLLKVWELVGITCLCILNVNTHLKCKNKCIWYVNDWICVQLDIYMVSSHICDTDD